jgi:glycosyltransferase involved in cell wall biosynthesis
VPPLVSVILPSFNRAAFLGEAIDSVLAQTHEEFELLVIDDGSTDGTGELVRQRYGGDARVRYQRQDNAGVSAARNRGITLSRGELIAFIDSDDIWQPWKLEVQLRCLELAPEAGMLWTDMQAIGLNGEEIAPTFLTDYYRAYRYFTRDTLFPRSLELRATGAPLPGEAAGRRLYVGDIFSQMTMGNLVHTPTVIMRRQRLEEVGLFDESFRQGGEDFDYWWRTCRAGPVAYADISSIRYRIGMSGNVSGPDNNVTMAESYLETVQRFLESDRSRIALPPRMIARALSHGHLWAGRGLLLEGSVAEARAHLSRSVRLQPAQPQALILAPLAYAPPALAVPVGRAMRAVKRAVGEGRAIARRRAS